MLRRFIEYQEREHHGRDSNRVSLPFEWGLEHVGLSATANGTAPDTLLKSYAETAVRDSAAFYGYQPAKSYAFDGHLLRFPSFVETPYPENNTVIGRYFPAGKDMAAVVLPQWNCKWDGQVGICTMIQKTGISALRLSLPYHHHRKPAELERAEYLISPNVGRTITAIRQAVTDARRAADWLFGRGYKKVIIVGTSIGSCIAFLTFLHDDRFSSGVFIHVSGFFADVVWSGLSTTHVRKAFDGHVDLDQLRQYWQPISPFPFIHRIRGTNRKMLMLAGEYDMTFPPQLTRDAFDEFDRLKIDIKKLWFPCGHYTMGKIPFNAIVGIRIQRFLAGLRNPR